MQDIFVPISDKTYLEIFRGQSACLKAMTFFFYDSSNEQCYKKSGKILLFPAASSNGYMFRAGKLYGWLFYFVLTRLPAIYCS